MQKINEMVQSRYGITPTHAGEELNQLARRFHDNIKFVAVYQKDEMLAGQVTYETQNVRPAQYLGSSQKGQKLGASELIVDYDVNQCDSSKKYFDFRRSTEKGGSYLNRDLAAEKEGFGARAITYDTYEVDVAHSNSL